MSDSQQKLQALNVELQRSIDGLNSEYDQNHQTLIGQIKEMNDITNELESMHKATTIGSLVGSSVGLAGGIASLVGFFLAPFTFGASLALTIGGAAVGIAGGVTGAASNITNMVKQTTLRENIEKIIEDFQTRIKPTIEHLSAISKTMEELEAYSAETKIILTSVRSIKTVSSITKLATLFRTFKIGEVAAKASKILQVVGKLSTAITSLFLIFDLYGIVSDSIEISEINQSGSERKEEDIKSETLKCIYQMRISIAEFQKFVDEIERVRDFINTL